MNKENKKVSIPFYKGMKLNVTVENGFLVAEYSEKQKKGIEEHPIGSIFEYVEPLKAGDRCIFWDDEKSTVDLCFLSKKENGYYEDVLGRRYENAIKCEKLKQYLEFKKLKNEKSISSI